MSKAESNKQASTATLSLQDYAAKWQELQQTLPQQTTGGQLGYVGPIGGSCPHCGYCPHCGRGGYHTYPIYY